MDPVRLTIFNKASSYVKTVQTPVAITIRFEWVERPDITTREAIRKLRIKPFNLRTE